MNQDKIKTNTPREAVLYTVISAILLFLFAFGAPFASSRLVTAFLIAGAGTFLLVIARKKFSVVLALFCLFGMFSTEAGFSLAAVALSVLIGTFLSARLYDRTRSPFVFAIPLAAYALIIAITRDVILAMPALYAFLPSIALAVGFCRKESSAGTVCLTSGALLLTVAAAVSASMLAEYGTIDFGIFTSTADEFKKMIAELLLSVEVAVSADETKRMFTQNEALNLATSIVSLFPAFLICACNIFAYISQKNLHALVLRAGEDEKLTDDMIALVLSPMAGIFFYISFFISSFSAEGVLATACENIFVIFIPGLALSGLMFQLARLAKTRRGGFIVVLMIGMLFFAPSYALLFAACLGAYYSIANPLSAFLRSRKN